ncbi:hypothetical protein ACQPW3_34710 [Actinosynnema sp. CA-248983]
MVELIDDLDCGKADESIAFFGLNVVAYAINLSEDATG